MSSFAVYHGKDATGVPTKSWPCPAGDKNERYMFDPKQDRRQGP